MEPVEVAQGVFWVRGPLVNWYLLEDGQDLTLVDTGYPRDLAGLLRSIARLGHQPHDVHAVLITHAHADHLGALAVLQATYGTPAQIGAADLQAARSGVLHQVTLRALLPHLWRPSVLSWTAAAVGRGGTRVKALPTTSLIRATTSGALDLPGHPVTVPTPGHTPGHTAFHLPAAGVVLSGDALVTAHPVSPRRGPQTLPPIFDTNTALASAALVRLRRLDADILLPGHGPPARGPIARTVDHALNDTDRRTLRKTLT